LCLLFFYSSTSIISRSCACVHASADVATPKMIQFQIQSLGADAIIHCVDRSSRYIVACADALRNVVVREVLPAASSLLRSSPQPSPPALTDDGTSRNNTTEVHRLTTFSPQIENSWLTVLKLVKIRFRTSLLSTFQV